MTIDKFPRYGDWVAVIARRDQGVLLVTAAVLFVVAWLCLSRFQFPKLLPWVREGTLFIFYVTLLALVLGAVK